MTIRGQHIWNFTLVVKWSYDDEYEYEGDQETYDVVAPTFDKALEKVRKIALSKTRKFKDIDDDGNETGKVHYPVSSEVVEVKRGEWIDG